MKRILLVAGNFLPGFDSAAVTAGIFAKYLVRNGWEVTVLARQASPGDRLSAPQPIPGLHGYHLYTGAGYADYPFAFRWLLKNGAALTPYRQSLLYLKSVRQAVRARVQERSFDLILGAVGPVAIIPAIAETSCPESRKALWFFDPSTLSSGNPYRSLLQVAFHRGWERKMLARFDFLFFHSPELAETYRRFLPESAHKIEVLYNGFDPEEVTAAPPSEAPGKGFWIGYFGTVGLAEARACSRLADAIRHLPEGPRKNFGFYLRGSFTKVARKVLGSRLESGTAASRWIQREDRVSPRRMLAEMRSCDLLLTSRSALLEWHPSGKIFWYLAAGKPIIYLGDPGASEARLILRARAGRIFHWDSPLPEISAFLKALARAKEDGKTLFYPDKDFISTLTAPFIVQEFTRIVTQSVPAGAASGVQMSAGDRDRR